MGSKTSDFRTVPMVREIHREYHDIGQAAFELKYGVDLEAEIVRLNSMYAEYRKGFQTRQKPVRKLSKVVAQCACGMVHGKIQIVRGRARFWCSTAREYRLAS